MARFADLMFAYIDELSAASVAGHTDELSTTGRVREQYLERLGRHLLAGAAADVLVAAAERADWPAPSTLTAVLLPLDHVRGVTSLVPAGTLRPREELPGLEESQEAVLLLVPDSAGAERQHLLRALAGRHAVVGPARPWMQARSSYLRALQTCRLPLSIADRTAGIDTEQHLAELVLGADAGARADLRAQVLAPLDGLRPATAERLVETLRSWLLHQGRRDDVAADLLVHAQTVRYRMGQLRELYGDRLQDPDTVLKLMIALGPELRLR
jgi:PucR-like helix-turn-helix protein